MYKTVNWNTGSAAARYRLKNKKKIKQQAPSNKPQAKRQARGGGELARKSSSATGLHDDVIILTTIPSRRPSITDNPRMSRSLFA